MSYLFLLTFNLNKFPDLEVCGNLSIVLLISVIWQHCISKCWVGLFTTSQHHCMFSIVEVPVRSGCMAAGLISAFSELDAAGRWTCKLQSRILQIPNSHDLKVNEWIHGRSYNSTELLCHVFSDWFCLLFTRHCIIPTTGVACSFFRNVYVVC